MTNSPTPFITSLRKEADGFANMLHMFFGVTLVIFLGWNLGEALGWLGPDPAGLKAAAEFAALGWLIFFGLAALIDYTIAAVARAFFEAFGALLLTIAKTLSTDSEPVEEVPPSAGSAVEYLRDHLSKRQKTDTDPLTPDQG